eukprot:TRINITY_DN18440_c0_g1_i1.p1 TRINITY_DN18440_c0_g1~~TRINITY_DN18440_c0_g1_i1.p1  ORF type:complete len:296 (+),score=50.21 TRINITY_DN18440_c0_g1_i1:71-889(+)
MGNNVDVCVCQGEPVTESQVEVIHTTGVPRKVASDQIPLWQQEINRLHELAASEWTNEKVGSETSTVASATELPEITCIEAPMKAVEHEDPIEKKTTSKPKSKPNQNKAAIDSASVPEVMDPDFDLSALTDEEKKHRLKAFVDVTGALGGVLYELQSGLLVATAHYVSKSAKRADFFNDACYKIKLTPGTGLPGRAFKDSKRAKLISDVSETTSVSFPRKNKATEANIRSLCCVRYGTGVLEVAFKKKVEQPPSAMKPRPRRSVRGADTSIP